MAAVGGMRDVLRRLVRPVPPPGARPSARWRGWAALWRRVFRALSLLSRVEDRFHSFSHLFDYHLRPGAAAASASGRMRGAVVLWVEAPPWPPPLPSARPSGSR